MNEQPKKDCCNGCQNGKQGTNSACKAKLMVEAISKAREQKELQLKFESYED